MNIQKYTEKAQEAIVAAQQVADRDGHPEITPEHVLLALVEQQGGIVPKILRKLNADPVAVDLLARGQERVSKCDGLAVIDLQRL